MKLAMTALKQYFETNGPIRVGLIGAGYMGRPVTYQLVNFTPGIQIVAIASHKIVDAERAYHEAGVDEPVRVDSQVELEKRIQSNQPAVLEDGLWLCQAEGIDVVLDMTGNAFFAAEAALSCFAHGRHFVTYTAELAGTVGPLLTEKAKDAGVTFTMADGDQPGVIMNLFHFVKSMGFNPLVCGNIKGLQDPYRNPTTQEGFAKKWGQKPHMVTSFADGTKVSFEMAVVANATGMCVPKRGMNGFELERGKPVEELTELYNYTTLKGTGGIVDYVVGASPAPGIYILASTEDAVQQKYLHLYKLGEGPLYCFYTPFHLCHFEVHNSIARAMLFNDVTIMPDRKPLVEVITIAKRDLKAGEVLDGIGYYMTYGECENADVVEFEHLLPMIFAEGCRLTTDISKDTAIKFSDVELPESTLLWDLYQEQKEFYALRHD
jgi:predicted homoserine dehydrogenase-like protein